MLAVLVAIIAIVLQFFLNRKRNEYILQIAEDILKNERDRSEMINAIVRSKTFTEFLLKRVEVIVEQYLETQKEKISSNLQEAIKEGLKIENEFKDFKRN